FAPEHNMLKSKFVIKQKIRRKVLFASISPLQINNHPHLLRSYGVRPQVLIIIANLEGDRSPVWPGHVVRIKAAIDEKPGPCP
ncbi:hypothetical protein, partial [Desulfobacter postgatei]|uniref:hypothetical protein n=1 Tax=Desulfobacter postgatei TaxID=2293 RepID=UPI002A36EFB7